MRPRQADQPGKLRMRGDKAEQLRLLAAHDIRRLRLAAHQPWQNPNIQLRFRHAHRVLRQGGQLHRNGQIRRLAPAIARAHHAAHHHREPLRRGAEPCDMPVEARLKRRSAQPIRPLAGAAFPQHSPVRAQQPYPQGTRPPVDGDAKTCGHI